MKKAFTLAELCTVIIILGLIAAVVAKMTFRTPQGQFDIKFDKTASVISSNIQMGLMRRTGFQFADYNNNNQTFLDDVTNNLDGNNSTIANAWSNNTNIGGTNISSYNAFVMRDGTVIAIDNAGTNIFIDVNGRNRPNEFGRDIFRYNASAPNKVFANNGGAGGGGENPAGGGAGGGGENPAGGGAGGGGAGGEPQGCVNPGHPETNATWSYNSQNCEWTPSCSGNYTLSGNSCVCNLAQKTENNIIYTADANCNYQATACATTTSSNGDFTYSYSLPNCTATKSGCTNTKKKLSGESCVCNDPATKTDATYKYTLDSNCTYQKTGCVNSKKTFNSSSKTCVCSNKSSCNTTTNDFNESNCTCTPNACSTTEINKKLQSANSSCRNAASALIAYCFKNMYSTCTKSCSNASACCSATASYVGMSVAQMIKSGRSVPAACR